MRLWGFYGFIAGLHLLGWSLYLHHAAGHPALVGLGMVAYLLGLRHAVDADHIAAVDDTVRYLMQKGRNPLGVGFWFSLGHSTVVLLLAIAIACSAGVIKDWLPAVKDLGGLIGASVSGLFLWTIGTLNLLVLVDILKVWEQAKRGTHGHAHLDRLLQQRGWMNRIFGGRLQKLIDRSWQMFPLGLLFGLGFESATEIGMVAMTAGASAGDMPIGALLSLPILFAAGMSLIDTTDSVLMVRAYDWAFCHPLRKIFYNAVTTGLSVVVALAIGTIELLQALIGLFDWHGGVFDVVRAIDFGMLGYLIVGLFVLGWALSIAWWKLGCFTAPVPRHVH